MPDKTYTKYRGTKRYRDEGVLRELYIDKQKSISEISEIFDVSYTCIHRWMEKHDIERRDLSEANSLAHPKQKPPVSESALREMYEERQMSSADISDKHEVSPRTVRRWMEYYGIERRPPAPEKHISLRTSKNGYEIWNIRGHTIHHHRLLAVAESGVDAIEDNVIHHRNGIRWDNRLENIEIMSPSEHSRHHAINDGIGAQT